MLLTIKFVVILLNKVVKMPFAFTTIVKRTKINKDEKTGKIKTDTDTVTTTEFPSETKQKTMDKYFEEVVRNNIPKELVLTNRIVPLLINTDRDIRMLTVNEMKSSIHDFAVATIKNDEPKNASICTFLIFLIVRKRKYSSFKL